MPLPDLNRIRPVLQHPLRLTQHISRSLSKVRSRGPVFPDDQVDPATAAAVLFLLGQCPGKDSFEWEPCVILNKRSASVRQPGDLCCPGGRLSPRLDAVLARLLRLPMLPLASWPYWPEWRQRWPLEAGWLRLLLATGLRESVEEMRLNPFGLKFLGPLQAQPLVMFQRVIYPMVAWISGQKRFSPNWEVEKIIYIPLRDLLNPLRYARYRLKIETGSAAARTNTVGCFRHQSGHESELLWGATYRITTAFLEIVFGFIPPDLDSLPEICGRLKRTYLLKTP